MRIAKAFRCTVLVVLVGGNLLAEAAVAEEPTVILLSWDGVRHDYPERGALPGLERMEREGLRASRMNPSYPSNTFPAHVTMATGARPGRHGIVDNQFHDTERGDYAMESDASWIEAEPIWIAAERQGVKAATFFWVGSETDWRGQRASLRRAPFDGDIGEAEKVDQILAWLDLPAAERPRLILSWWHGADSVAHWKGPEHEDILSSLQEQDAQLQRLFAGIEARGGFSQTTVFVVSDHGMAEISNPIDIGPVLESASVEARVSKGSSMAHVFLADTTQQQRAAEVLRGIEGVAVHERGGFPAAFGSEHPTRTGDLLVTTDPPNTLAEAGFLRVLFARVSSWMGWTPGLHGYSPEHPDMGAIFYALGRGAPAGARIDGVSSIDLAPTVAGLLGIEAPRDAEGSRISSFRYNAP